MIRRVTHLLSRWSSWLKTIRSLFLISRSGLGSPSLHSGDRQESPTTASHDYFLSSRPDAMFLTISVQASIALERGRPVEMKARSPS